MKWASRRAQTIRDMSDIELQERIAQIQTDYDGWSPHGGTFSITMFDLLDASSYQINVFDGAWSQYPSWFLDDMQGLQTLIAYNRYVAEYTRRIS